MEYTMTSPLDPYIFQMLGSRLFKCGVERVAMFDIYCCISRAVDQQERRCIGRNIS